MYKLLYRFVFVTLLLLPPIASAHPGRTDAYGCHTCRTNCAKWGLSTGEYHCHNAKALPQPLPPVTSHSNGVTEPAPQYAKPKVEPTVTPVQKPIVKTETKVVPKKEVKVEKKTEVKPVQKVTPKAVVKPVVKPENKTVSKPVEKPIVTSTPAVQPKAPTKSAPVKESWWSKIKKWF